MCPGNNEDRLKVMIYGYDEHGYIARGKYINGTIEGLKHFFPHNKQLILYNLFL